MAKYVNREGCMGGREQFYQAERIDSTGQHILASGDTEELAEARVEAKLQEREAFLRLPLLEQLDLLTRKKYMSSQAVQDSVKLIARILMSPNKHDPNWGDWSE